MSWPPGVDAGVVARLRAAGCVYAEAEALILAEAAASPDELTALVERRAAGEPLEYIVGWAEFCGLRIPVCPGVFVPRRRSEFIAARAVDAVRAISERADHGSRPVKVLDMCCGSGAIGLAVAILAENVHVLAVDISPAATDCARANLAPAAGLVYTGDLFAALPRTHRRSLDVIVANAPYVPTGEIETLPAEARLHEPLQTLDGGEDGLDVQRRILADAAGWLSAGGLVLVETSLGRSDETARIARENGFTARISESDDLGVAVVEATLAR